MFENPCIYAVLLGSGVSRSAGFFNSGQKVQLKKVANFGKLAGYLSYILFRIACTLVEDYKVGPVSHQYTALF